MNGNSPPPPDRFDGIEQGDRFVAVPIETVHQLFDELEELEDVLVLIDLLPGVLALQLGA